MGMSPFEYHRLLMGQEYYSAIRQYMNRLLFKIGETEDVEKRKELKRLYDELNKLPAKDFPDWLVKNGPLK